MVSSVRCFWALIVVAIVGTSSLAAEVPTGDNASHVDTSSSAVPNLAFQPTPSDVKHYDAFNYYSKRGVEFSSALADMRECKSYSLILRTMSPAPSSVPIGGNPDPKAQRNDENRALVNSFAMFGLIGVGIASIEISNEEADLSSENTRRCMHYRGYTRYGTSRSIWHQLHSGTDQEVETKLAEIASTPNPTGTSIEP